MFSICIQPWLMQAYQNPIWLTAQLSGKGLSLNVIPYDP